MKNSQNDIINDVKKCRQTKYFIQLALTFDLEINTRIVSSFHFFFNSKTIENRMEKEI